MTREEAITIIDKLHLIGCGHNQHEDDIKTNIAIDMAIEALQEVQKHEETFEWCHDCKEYDTENYCCHRWSKVIRNTVEELKAEPLPQYEEWQDEFNKMCESARPKTFVADEWYRDTFKGEEE